MMFNPVGSLVGAGIKTFLLETSRVVSQHPGEKNYHVFYELLSGMNEQAGMRFACRKFTLLKLLPDNDFGLIPETTIGRSRFDQHNLF